MQSVYNLPSSLVGESYFGNSRFWRRV